MARRGKAILNVLLLAAVVLAGVPAVFAQEKEADNMQIVIEKVRADKKLLVAENMQLSEAEAKAFWPVYDRFQDELFLIRARTLRLLASYKDSYEKMDNATAKKLLDEYINIETLRLKLYQAYLPKFRKVLPETKTARYYQIENKIQAALMYEIAQNIPLVGANK
jgi:hypothetical protein